MATVTAQVARIRTRFKKDPNARVISDSTVVAFLNEAQDIIETNVVLPAMQQSSTINLVADQQEYTLAADLFKPQLFRYTSNDWVLKQQSFLSIQNRFDDASGTPQEYYIRGASVGFFPVPSAAETDGVKYWYIKTLGEMVESGATGTQVTTSEVPENFHWVLERGAEKLMFEMIGAFNRAQQAAQEFERGIQLMREAYSSMSSNYDSTLYTEGDMSGARAWRFTPYAT